ncbi:MAG: ABC transporter permease [Pseudomonadota bacterium]
MSDAVIAALLLSPNVLTGAALLWGFRPLPLVGALLKRYRWIAAVFVALIAVSVAMGAALIAQERALREGSARAAKKFDMVIAAPGSELTLMFATVFLQPSNVPLLDGFVFNEIAAREEVEIAAPLAFGDSYEGAPLVGTTPEFLVHLTEGEIEGRLFEAPLEGVAGAALNLEIGHTFAPAHGVGESAEEGLHEDEYTIVGRMAPTGSPWDRAIIVPVEGVWQTHGLSDGKRSADAPVGPPFVSELFPGTPAIIVRMDRLPDLYSLRAELNAREDTMAFFPGTVLAGLYSVMGDIRDAMSLMALVTQVLVAVAVLTGLFILTRLFRRQLTLLHVLGAPRRFVVGVLWSFATALLVAGVILGLALGAGATSILSSIVSERIDVLITARLSWPELHLALGFLSLSSALAAVVGLASPRGTTEALRN